MNLSGKKVKLQIWDTAGQEKYRTITTMYYKGAHGIILAFSCDDHVSFENVENWLKQIKQNTVENVVVVLVANKCDLTDREVTKEEGQALADKYNLSYFECSAKENTGITPAFTVKGAFISADFY